MLFTSPAFLLLFVPLMLAVYAMIPPKLRRAAVCLFSLVFYVLANLKRPVCILFLLMTAVFTYCGSFAVAGLRTRPVILFAVAVPAMTLVLLRVLTGLADAGAQRFLPLGASFYLLASISCMIDVYRKDAPVPDSFADALTYISFFPVTIAGPLIRYKDFVRITKEENIHFTTASVACGIELYMLGFIKRVAVSEVLNEGYERLASPLRDAAAEGIDLVPAFGMAILILLITYFAFSGYSDMGRGLSMMLGISLREDFGSVLLAVTPGEYTRNFLASLREWIDDYLRDPMLRLCGCETGPAAGLCACAGLCAGMLWFRSAPAVLLLMAPMMIFVFFGAAYPGVVRFVRRNLFLRLCGRILTSLLFALFFIIVQTGDPAALLSDLGRLTVLAPLQSYTLYLTLFNREYLLVACLVLLIRVPVLLGLLAPRHPEITRIWRSPAAQAVWAALLLGLFVFTLGFILPRYPAIASTPYMRMSL